jgi:hypothetical protein
MLFILMHIFKILTFYIFPITQLKILLYQNLKILIIKIIHLEYTIKQSIELFKRISYHL